MLYINFLLAIEVILLIFIYINNHGDVFAPSFISLSMFFLATMCISYNKDLWSVTYDRTTFGIVFLGFVCIFFADILAQYCSKYHVKIRNNYGRLNRLPQHIDITTKMTFIISLIMFVGLAEQIYELYKISNSLGFGFEINTIGVVKESDISFSVVGKFAYQINNMMLTIFIFVISYNNDIKGKIGKRWDYLIPLIIGVSNLILTGARSLLFRAVFAFIIVFVISYKKRHKRIKSDDKLFLLKQIVFPTFVIMLVFYGLRVVTKGTTKSAGRSFIEYISYYFGSPLYIFNKYIVNPEMIASKSKYYGGYTFAGFYNSLYKWGIIDNSIADLKYVYVGDISNGYYIGGNEYSLFMRPYADFGIVGMALFVFALFFVFSLGYYKTVNFDGRGLSIYWLLVYSYFFYIVPMAFYYPFTVQESKIMNIIYMIIMVLLFRLIIESDGEMVCVETS